MEVIEGYLIKTEKSLFMRMKMQEDKMERVRCLDFFKGVAIILVIIGHCNWTYSERMKYGFPFWVDMAVPVFMIISGYLYAKSYNKHNINTFEEAWKWDNILDKVVRYTVPFVISYIIEIVLRLMNGSYSGLRHSLLVFLGGVMDREAIIIP